MPALAQTNDRFRDGSSAVYSLSANGFWSNNRDDVGYNHLSKFWSELPSQARQELLKIDKQTLFEQARKNMYCSRCNGLLLEGFLQIVMYGKSLQQEGASVHFPWNGSSGVKNQNNSGSDVINALQDEFQDPSVLPWGGLTSTRDGLLTLMNCYLHSKSLEGLQIVFDGARARERERELLYPDACGGGGRGWISQGIVSYGRGHGTRETCALHTARLSCDTLVDFWSALGEETRQSLLRMKEEDFIERLVYRFDSKRFCRDCRRNVIREFKELKELKRMHREPRCTSWFCVADSAFQYEVSDDSVQADWRHTFADTMGLYHHFEWAVGTSEGKSDILDFENVGMNGSVQANGLNLSGLGACFITLRAWKLDGRCTEHSVKAHALKGQQCVHCRLIVGDGWVKITKGESIRSFFEHAEEAEEEEDDESTDRDGNELDGECSRPQKHAKSPELAREFLLDAATVIFKEQVEKAFREGTARQNAHSIFVCLALKLLEERVYVACKEIITLEKQMKLLEEEEKEKREEEQRKERRRTKEREKKLRRKERLKGKEKDKSRKSSESNDGPGSSEAPKEELPAVSDMEQTNAIVCRDSFIEMSDANLLEDGSPDIQDDELSTDYDRIDEVTSAKDGTDTFTMDQSNISQQRLRFRKEYQLDLSQKWSDRHRCAVVWENGSMVGRLEPRHCGDSFVASSRRINGSNRQYRINPQKSYSRNVGIKYSEKFHGPSNRNNDRYDFHSCSCNVNNEYKRRTEQNSPMTRVSRETRPPSKSESAIDTSKQNYRGSKYNQVDYMHESSVRPKNRAISGNYPGRELLHSKKVWEPMESQKNHLRSNSDTDVTLRSHASKVQGVRSDNNQIKSSAGEVGIPIDIDDEDIDLKMSKGVDEGSKNDFHLEAAVSYNSNESACEESGVSPTRSSTLNGSSDQSQGSMSNSDKSSLCLSEGDSNTSSNRGNTESSTTSDSEDASQQSEGREISVGIENGLSACHEVGVEKDYNANREGSASRLSFVPSSDGAGSDISGNPGRNKFIKGYSASNPCSEPQSMLAPGSNRNIQFSVFQAPSTIGYYHQNPLSWPAAATNGLLPFPHPNHYLYASPLGYGLNEDSQFCLQYGALQQPMPVFSPATIPVYQQVSKANGLNTDERPQTTKPALMQDNLNGCIVERGVRAGSKTAFGGKVGNESITESQANNSNSSFSLFHFGGPVALSNGCKSFPASSNGGTVEATSLKSLVDQPCNKKETKTMEEYALFAATNSLSFSISN
ncbi:hypothetical protein QN277_013248 [Acacia crassicarpa]|uniref:Uncharacterized protein n=1 Tax=Acacia crassicarpa TaxID=499986 RepID=A0AAE1TEI8_9FABA|nr:hypothetical protein QN277_013248 [Acacia crassicarpa]